MSNKPTRKFIYACINPISFDNKDAKRLCNYCDNESRSLTLQLLWQGHSSCIRATHR